MADLNFEDERINFTPFIMYIEYVHLLHDNYLKKKYDKITPRDVTYIINIFYNQNCSQKYLADLLQVSESNVTQIIKKLEKKNLIVRTNDVNNKSRKVLNLTDEGKLIAVSLIKHMYEWEGEFFKDYSDSDVEKFKKMIYSYAQKTIESI